MNLIVMLPLYIILGIYLISIVGVVIINRKRSSGQNTRILLNFIILILLSLNFIYLNKFTSLVYVILAFIHIFIAFESYTKLYSHNKALSLSIRTTCSVLYLTSFSLLLKPPVDYDQFSRTIGFIIWIFGSIIILVFGIKEILEKDRKN